MLLTSAQIIESRAPYAVWPAAPRKGCSALKVAIWTSVVKADVAMRTVAADIWVNDRSGVGVSRSVLPIVITDEARPAGGGPPARSLTMIDGTNSGGCLRSTTAINGCSSWRHLAGLSV